MRRFGLIGFPLSHSFSKSYFRDKFLRERISECSYENFAISEINLLKDLLADPELCGLNVTIPFKEKVIAYLDEFDEVVQSTGACNCIKIVSGKLSGFNTDVTGFRLSLQKHLRSNHTKALVLGEGGAAKAVAFVLRELGIEYMNVVRSGTEAPSRIHYHNLTQDHIKSYSLIINSTPVGTFPKIDEAPLLDFSAINQNHYLYDLVYNPEKTKFLQLGEERGATIKNGFEMLVLQAEEAWRIWNS